MPVKIDFAIVDVKGTRKRLAKRVAAGERVPVAISGYLDQPQNDDGESQEFTMIVTDFAVDGEKG